MRKQTNGFTLLELSVVLVIIGIFAGGIVVVQALVRSSHLTRILSDYDSYVKAISEFQTKFLAYPGDMNNAESMWASDASCPNTPTNTVRKIPTCNGNGDGKIGDSTAAGVLSVEREWFRTWQHLAGAGFIQERFTGVPGPAGNADAVAGVNIPEGSINNTGWNIHYLLLTTADTDLWRGKYGHVMNFGEAVSGNRPTRAALTAQEALAIDTKVDDGKPGKGIIRAWRTTVLPNCTVTDTSADAQAYSNATTGGEVCSLVFVLGF
jgi:prepilin-type N-terminal cleavage/methylation domain-containing protein